jgi:hypothetical protein
VDFSSFHIGPFHVEFDFVKKEDKAFVARGSVKLPLVSLNEFLASFFKFRLKPKIDIKGDNGVVRYNGITCLFSPAPAPGGIALTFNALFLFDLIPVRGKFLKLLEKFVLNFLEIPGLRYSEEHLYIDLSAFLPPFFHLEILEIGFQEKAFAARFEVKVLKKKES